MIHTKPAQGARFDLGQYATARYVMTSAVATVAAEAVRDVMTRPVFGVRPSASLREIAKLMEERRIKRVPVLDAGRLVDIVSRAGSARGRYSGLWLTPRASVYREALRAK